MKKKKIVINEITLVKVDILKNLPKLELTHKIKIKRNKIFAVGKLYNKPTYKYIEQKQKSLIYIYR